MCKNWICKGMSPFPFFGPTKNTYKIFLSLPVLLELSLTTEQSQPPPTKLKWNSHCFMSLIISKRTNYDLSFSNILSNLEFNLHLREAWHVKAGGTLRFSSQLLHCIHGETEAHSWTQSICQLTPKWIFFPLLHLGSFLYSESWSQNSDSSKGQVPTATLPNL